LIQNSPILFVLLSGKGKRFNRRRPDKWAKNTLVAVPTIPVKQLSKVEEKQFTPLLKRSVQKPAVEPPPPPHFPAGLWIFYIKTTLQLFSSLVVSFVPIPNG
jgi:hypothetical protein